MSLLKVAAPPAMNGSSGRVRIPWGRLRERGAAALFVIPALVGLAIFQYYPVAVSAFNEFRSFNAFTGAPTGFAGMANFRAMFADSQFRSAVLVTILYVVVIVAIEVPVGLMLAELVNRRLPASALLRTVAIAALACSETVAALIWNQMYNPSSGLFNSVLKSLGLPAQQFVASPHEALISLVLISVWKDVGLTMLIMLVGLQAISPEIYEAAALDGVSEFRRMVHITLPLLRRSIGVAVFMSTVTGSRVFTSIILITQGGPGNSTRNLIYYGYQQGFQYSNYGVAYASTILMIVLLGIITVVQFGILRERDV